MRITLFIFAIIFYPFSVKCQSTIELDKQNGYNGYTFDMDIDTVIKDANAILDSSTANHRLSFYRMENAGFMKLGEFLTEVDIIKYNRDSSIYGFFFQFVKFLKPEYELIKLWLTSLYGEPTQQDHLLNRCQWNGKTTLIFLSYNDEFKLTDMKLINIKVLEKFKLLEFK